MGWFFAFIGVRWAVFWRFVVRKRSHFFFCSIRATTDVETCNETGNHSKKKNIFHVSFCRLLKLPASLKFGCIQTSSL